MNTISVTIIYDNYSADDRLRTAHGFACYIQGLEQTVLFDTGWSGQLLRNNMEQLGLARDEIDVVVLSHMDWDHIGGLETVLNDNPQLTVHLPRSFSQHLGEEVCRIGARLIKTEGAHDVCPGARTTGVLAGPVDEQALCIRTRQGTVVITGCAHPGIVDLTRAAGEACGYPLYAALGGFHMSGASADEIQDVIGRLKELGVKVAAPSHCSGDLARSMFMDAYGDNYQSAGVGWQFTLQKPAETTHRNSEPTRGKSREARVKTD